MSDKVKAEKVKKEKVSYEQATRSLEMARKAAGKPVSADYDAAVNGNGTKHSTSETFEQSLVGKYGPRK